MSCGHIYRSRFGDRNKPARGIATANPVGTDSFEYKLCDFAGLCDTATVTITVTLVDEPQTPLVAVPDDYIDAVEEPGFFVDAAQGVLKNDTDPNGDALTASLETDAANGSVNLNPDGSFTYTPDPDYNGTDTFAYEVCDTDGEAGRIIRTAVGRRGPRGRDPAGKPDPLPHQRRSHIHRPQDG
jgi:hypothetical protein